MVGAPDEEFAKSSVLKRPQRRIVSSPCTYLPACSRLDSARDPLARLRSRGIKFSTPPNSRSCCWPYRSNAAHHPGTFGNRSSGCGRSPSHAGVRGRPLLAGKRSSVPGSFATRSGRHRFPKAAVEFLPAVNVHHGAKDRSGWGDKRLKPVKTHATSFASPSPPKRHRSTTRTRARIGSASADCSALRNHKRPGILNSQ